MALDAGERAAMPEHLVVGHITKAHGTKGELFVWPLTDRPDDVFAVGKVLLVGDEEGALAANAPSVAIEQSRPFKRGLLVKFAELDDRTEVDALARHYLLVPVSEIAPLEQDELFYHELLGATVETVHGDHVGVVREVFETMPNHLLELKRPDGKLQLIPFADRIVKVIDRERRRIVIDPPEGLLDL